MTGSGMPRIHWAVESASWEHAWLPRLAPYLELPVPAPVALDEWVRTWTGRADSAVDRSAVLAVWEDALAAPELSAGGLATVRRLVASMG